jgi:ankyrin repeat protein
MHHLSTAQLLIEREADINNANNKGCTPLRLAVDKLLIDNEVDIDETGQDGMGLLYTCEDDQLEAIKFLIEKGADVNKTDDIGCTPLRWACEEGHFSAIRLLIGNVADLSKEGEAKMLIMTCENGIFEVVELLIQRGVDVNMTTKSNDLTLLHLTCSLGHTDVAKMLEPSSMLLITME